MHEIRSTILSGDTRPGPVARKSKGSRAADGAGALTKIAIKRQEARVTNQRCEDRLPNRVVETVIAFRRKKQTVRVINVSSRGAMFACDIEPRIGESIDVFFSDQNRTRCAVRWVREGRIGVEFLDETIFWESEGEGPVFRAEPAEPAEPAPKPQLSGPREIVEREPRQALLRRGTLYWSGISIPVRLRNVSPSGARLESEHELQPGEEVELDLGDAGFQTAEVRWATDGQVGLRFAGQVDLDALVPHPAASAPQVPDVLKPAYLETETRADSPWAARFQRLTVASLGRSDDEA